MISDSWIVNELRRHKSLVINAYPGFGKSRLAARIAKEWVESGGRVILMTRSRLEALQLCAFLRELNIRDKASLLLGREVMCPFNAQSMKQCILFRLNGICNVKNAVTTSLVLNTCDLTDYVNLGICPYEVNKALAHQLPIVVTTHAYLTNNELYLELINILNDWNGDNTLLIIDEFHNVIPGIETTINLDLDEVKQWAMNGNKLAEKILQEIFKVVPQNEEVVILRNFRMDELLEGSETMSDLVLKILVHHGDDFCAFTFDGKIVRLRCLSLKPTKDLIKRVSSVLLLSASVSKRFVPTLSLVDLHPQYIDVNTIPKEYSMNLRILVTKGLRFTYDARMLKPYIDLINEFIKWFVNSAPIIGGLAVFFPSIEYLKFFVNDHLTLPWGIPTFILDDSSSSINMINKFKEETNYGKALLITYVQSPLGEGINFLGNELIGVMLVGFPLPQFSQWGFMKAKFYSRKGVGGFTTTYLFPAISLTVQIIGRLLRDLDRHKKVAVLLDERFYVYKNFMPKWLITEMRVLPYTALLRSNPWNT